MTNETPNVLVINEYEGTTANKRQLFGIRGIGEKDFSFWRDIRENYKPIYDNSDWPWSYLAFNEDEEAKFRAKYAADIDFVKLEPEDKPYDCVLDNPKRQITDEEYEMEVTLQSILVEEIQKEINKYVIEAINTAATKK